ncbi:MAG: phage holin [Paludibacteraceae bacterium]|nr:phage holin [Paludibacteraceae bacterium]
MNEIWFKLILSLIPVLSIIITGFIVPLIKEKIGYEKLVKYEEWATQAVQAAELLFNERGMGKTKKEYVVNFLNEIFNKKKIVITPEQIEVLIESAVKQMKLSEIN